MRCCIVGVEVAAVVQTDSHIGKLIAILGVSPGCAQVTERLAAKTEAAGMPEPKAVAPFMRDQLHTRIIGPEPTRRQPRERSLDVPFRRGCEAGTADCG